MTMDYILTENIDGVQISGEMADALRALSDRDHRTVTDEISWIVEQYLMEHECEIYPRRKRMIATLVPAVDKE